MFSLSHEVGKSSPSLIVMFEKVEVLSLFPPKKAPTCERTTLFMHEEEGNLLYFSEHFLIYVIKLYEMVGNQQSMDDAIESKFLYSAHTTSTLTLLQL